MDPLAMASPGLMYSWTRSSTAASRSAEISAPQRGKQVGEYRVTVITNLQADEFVRFKFRDIQVICLKAAHTLQVQILDAQESRSLARLSFLGTGMYWLAMVWLDSQ